MEKISYSEAKGWFWTRTVIWSIPAIAISIATHYYYSGDYLSIASVRVWASVLAGIATVALASLSGLIAMNLPWMRRGKQIGFLLTALFCALVSAFIAFLIGSLILAQMQKDPVYAASTHEVELAYAVMKFSIATSAFWGFLFGAWFNLRRDRYFVEQF